MARILRLLVFAAALLLGSRTLAGCGSADAVPAVAPAREDRLTGTVLASGRYTLFRAHGIIGRRNPRLDPIWIVWVSAGDRLGFRWIVDITRRWEPQGGFRLQAFAGSQTRDLGAFSERDVSYLWAASEGDAVAYIHDQWTREAIEDLIMR